MGGDLLHVEDLQPVHGEKVGEAANRIITKVFVVDRVVLQIIQQSNKVVRLGDENPIWRQHFQNAADDLVHVFNVGKAVRCGYDLGRTVFLPDFSADLAGKIALNGG